MEARPEAGQEVSDQPAPDLYSMLDEARRELRLRRSVYPVRVADGKMTRAEAARRIRNMAAIVDRLAAEYARRRNGRMKSQVKFALAHPVFDPERQIVPGHYWRAGDTVSACLTVNIGEE